MMLKRSKLRSITIHQGASDFIGRNVLTLGCPSITGANALRLINVSPNTIKSRAIYWRQIAVRLVVALSLWLGYNSLIKAADQVDGDKALERFSDTQWYNASSGTFTPPNESFARDNSLRRDGWQGKPVKESNWDWWDWSGSNNRPIFPAISVEWMTFLGYLFLAILAGGLIGALLWLTLRDYLPSMRRRAPQAKEILIDPARVEDLPFEARPEMGDPLSAARHFKAQGDLDSAIIYLYGYMLLALDTQRHIHLQKGKTNRMYLRELRSADLANVLHMGMLAFEDTFFGRLAIRKERFDEVWERMDEFHQLLATATPPQASAKPVLGVNV